MGESPPHSEDPLGASASPQVEDAAGWRKRAVKARLFDEPDAAVRIGRFVVLGTLGSGGMGSVLRAYDATLDRQIAIKLMHPGIDEQHDHRMLREAQALAKLSHPNVVQVYEVGEVDGQLFIAMELVSGQTLEQWQDGTRPWRQCLEIYVQAGRGLAAAHSAGMIHRDFKPSNCILDEGGRVRVLDFGLARHTEVLEEEDRARKEAALRESIETSGSSMPPATSSSLLEKKLTMTGSVLGTIAYMAPEQMRGLEVDGRADQYSFCISLHEALFGDRPLPNDAVGKVSTASGSRLAIAARRVPRWLVRALERGLAKDPRARWPSMDVLLDALERRLRRRSAGWVGGLVLAGAVVTGVMMTEDRGEAPPSQGPCHDAARGLAGIWEEDDRERVREAIFGTELAFAQETSASVTSQLDEYVEGLRVAYVDACEATMVRHEQTRDDLRRRTGCVDERVGALQQTLEVLARADAEVVENAVTMVAALPEQESCAEVATRRPDVTLAPEAPGSEALRARIQQARVLAEAGKPREGLDVIEPVFAELTGPSTTVLLAEARLVEGILRWKLGEHEPAARQLQLALRLALAQDVDTVAVEALRKLVYLVGVDQAKVEAGAYLGAIAESLVSRDGASSRAKAEVLTAVGQLSSTRGEHALAQSQLERALELMQGSVGTDHIALAELLDSIGVTLSNQDEHEAARERYARALEIRERWQGPRHPSTVHQRINLGVVLGKLGRHPEAQHQYRAALEVLVTASVEHHELIAHAHSALGVSLAGQEDYGDAIEQLELAIPSWEAAHGPTHPRVAIARLNLAGTLRAAEQYEPAVEEYERALAILRSSQSTPAIRANELAAIDGMIKSLLPLGRDDEVASLRAELERPQTAVP